MVGLPKLAATIYEDLAHGTVVKHNDKIRGRNSGLIRQIDVSIRTNIAGHEILVIVQAKALAVPADVNVVREARAVMEDIGAAKGVLICSGGLARTVISYAENLEIDLCSVQDAQSQRWAGRLPGWRPKRYARPLRGGNRRTIDAISAVPPGHRVKKTIRTSKDGTSMNDPAPLPDPEQIQKLFQKWWAVTASIIATLTSAFGALQIPSQWARGIATAVTVIGLILVLVLYRKQAQETRVRARSEDPTKTDPQRPEGAAFRGLRRFRAGDKLPGTARRRIASTLLTEVQQPSFDMAIVTGDSGAGKSSLLECALVQDLLSSGYAVEFISNLSTQLPMEKTGAEDTTIALTRIWRNIRSRVANMRGEGEKPVVLILDQFEELISRIPFETRDTLGDELRRAINERWRIVIGLRKEFLAELKEVAARLGRPLSLNDIFILRNFDVPEAAEVIRECASRDRISIDDELPALIAGDLAVDGSVRPPDLQIVCDALLGEMTVGRYRSEGRAVGLRSRFIKDTVGLTGDSKVASAVLRELCDLPNNKKRPNPVSAQAIVERVRTGAAGARATLAAVESVLVSLHQSYIVVRDDEQHTALWSLIHDYIVEPIKIATEEQANRTDTVSAELDYFLAEAAARRVKTIPLSRLREIRAYAPPSQLALPAVRRLIRRSIVMGYGMPVLAASGIALVSIVAVVLAGASWNVWQPYGTTLSHWDKGERRGHATASSLNPSYPNLVVTDDGFGEEPSSRVAIWDTSSGKRLGVYSGALSVAGGALWSYDGKGGRLSRLIVKPGNKIEEEWHFAIPASDRPPESLRVVDVLGEPPKALQLNDPIRLRLRGVERLILDIPGNTWKRVLNAELRPSDDDHSDGTATSSDMDDELLADIVSTANRARLSVFVRAYARKVFDAQFDTHSVSMVGFIEAAGTHYLSIVVDRQIRIIPIRRMKNGTDPEFEVQPVVVRDLPKELTWKDDYETYRSVGNVFNAAHQYVFVEPGKTSTVFWPFDPVTAQFGEPTVSAAPAPSIDGWNRPLSWSPRGKKGTMIWMWQSDAASWLPHVEVQPRDRIVTNGSGTRMLILHEDNTADLWAVDLRANTDKHLATIDVRNVNETKLSPDDRLVIARQEGGVMHGWRIADGKYLGTLGSVGSDVIWSAYEPACERIFVWTEEGQRLQWRLGTIFPLYGFVPTRACVGE